MKKILLIMAVIAALTSCDSNTFHIDGTIEGASDTTVLVLERSRNGEWIIEDSIKVDKNGKFSASVPAPAVPNIYQLRCGDSEHAEQIMKIDKGALQFTGGKGTPAELQAWKDELARQIVADPGGIVAYYAINKYIDGNRLFDPMNDNDLRIIGAVANSFNSFHPDDPRTEYLVERFTEDLRRRRAQSAPRDTIFADVASLIDIKLQDYHGKEYVLSKVAAENRVVLLNFTAYTSEMAPQFNKLFNDIYQQYHSRGLAIYQVSMDMDNVAWRQAAENLPWITVYDPMGVNSQNVGAYHVNSLATTFIIRNGEIVERVEDITGLKAAVAKYI